jgi:hypothetical protein
MAVLFAYDAYNLAGNAMGGGLLFDSHISGPNGNSNPADEAASAVKFVSPLVYNGKVYVATKTGIDVYGLKAKGTAISEPELIPTPSQATNSGMNFIINTVDYKNTTCPGFQPAAQYDFVIQPCGPQPEPPNGLGGTYPTCRTEQAMSAGAVTSLEQHVNVPVSSSSSVAPIQVPIEPGNYEILPGTIVVPNAEPANGTATINVEAPYLFTVQPNTFVTLPLTISCTINTPTTH